MKRCTKAGYELDISVLPGGRRYLLEKALPCHSQRYGKTATVPAGFVMDGATGAMDILTRGWVEHDWLTDSGVGGPRNLGCLWDDGTPCTRWQSSMELYDRLREDGYWIRAPCWAVVTWLAGLI